MKLDSYVYAVKMVCCVRKKTFLSFWVSFSLIFYTILMYAMIWKPYGVSWWNFIAMCMRLRRYVAYRKDWSPFSISELLPFEFVIFTLSLCMLEQGHHIEYLDETFIYLVMAAIRQHNEHTFVKVYIFYDLAQLYRWVTFVNWFAVLLLHYTSLLYTQIVSYMLLQVGTSKRKNHGLSYSHGWSCHGKRAPSLCVCYSDCVLSEQQTLPSCIAIHVNWCAECTQYEYSYIRVAWNQKHNSVERQHQKNDGKKYFITALFISPCAIVRYLACYFSDNSFRII